MGRSSRRKVKRGPSVGLIVGLVCGGVFLVGAITLAILTMSKTNPKGPGQQLTGIPGIEMDNSRVTEGNCKLLRRGFSLTEVEAILGKGHTPTPEDFDASFGTGRESPAHPFNHNRMFWEGYAERGEAFAWGNGAVRIMIRFNQPLSTGGTLFAIVLRNADGSPQYMQPG